MAAGAGVMLLMVLPALYFGTDEESARRHDSRARSIELVDRMRLSLASASEAEKSAVLSKADEDSEAHAGQARAAVADVERVRKDLLNLLAKSGTQKQRDALEQFAGAFVEFRKVDDEILALAVRNTNLKAYSLAFGPAAVALEEMDAALSRLATTSAPSPRGQQVNLLVFGARTAALRIQVLLAPHIAEETDERMDDLEARMA
ncbi:MAG: hypothetical protein QOD06_2458, partial [Candidatus Binatota bacterium]|nr:hypothetical protein [Candidatus Binatota bacterium]